MSNAEEYEPCVGETRPFPTNAIFCLKNRRKREAHDTCTIKMGGETPHTWEAKLR